MMIFAKYPIAAGFIVCRWTLVRFFIVAVLLTAVTLKAYQLATVPVLDDGLLHAKWFNILAVEFEIFFGFWLITGLLPRLTWLASVGLFSVFSIVSLYKAVTGEASCGCFGAVTVNPWITTVFDIVVVGLLVLCRPTARFVFARKMLISQTTCSVVLSYLAIVVPLTYLMLTYEPAVLTTDGNVVGNVKTVMLYPQDWVGNEFPLLKHIELPADLGKGNWSVVLYGTNCSECKKHFEVWQSEGFQVDSEDEQIALLEISGQSENALRSRFDNKKWYWGCLKRTNDWYVGTPCVLVLDNGVVKRVSVK